MRHILILLLFILPFGLPADEASDKAEADLRKEWSDRLTEMGLKDRDHAWVLEEEMKIASRLLKIADEKKRKAENHKLHCKKAKKLISAYGFGKMPKYPKYYLVALEIRWEDWWFMPKKARLVKLQEMLDDLEANELDLRQTNGQGVRDILKTEMFKINQKRNIKLTNTAQQAWDDTWSKAMGTPWRLYKARKKGFSTDLKRIGFHSLAVKAWEKTLDKLFEEPEAPGE